MNQFTAAITASDSVHQFPERYARLFSLVREAGAGVIEGGGFFREVLEALPAAVYITDRNGTIIYYNEAAAALWGHRPELGRSEWCGSWKLYWPDGKVLPHGECPMAIALKESRPIRGMEAVAERPDGSRVPFIPFPTPLYDASGALIGAVNMLVDITDRKRAEESAQRLASIVECSDDAIVSKDLEGVITSWNRGAERLFGYTAQEAVGKPVSMLIPADRKNEEPEILRRVRSGEKIDHYDTIRRRKDGSLIDISLTVSPVKDAEGRIVGASKIARDITDRRRAHEQQVLLLNEMKHRIKNTLATVQSIAVQTLRTIPDDVRAAFIARLHAMAATHDLLSLESWNRAPLNELVARVLEAFQEKHCKRFVIDGPANIFLDANTSLLLGMALHELATNAVKYGALSNASGHVRISWKSTPGKQGTLMSLLWDECDGPRVKPPEHKGFGSLLLERALQRELGARIAFNPEGLACRFEVSF
jgi:PAS domain S-box-containing protein